MREKTNDSDAAPRLVVIDDQPVARAGIQQWAVNEWHAWEPVLGYDSVAVFLAEHQRPSTREVVIYDPEFGEQRPDYTGLQRLRTLGYIVIAYSRLLSAEVVLSCLDSGAASYIVKTAPPQQLRDAVVAIQHGAAFVGPHAEQALQKASRIGRPSLSPQERRVLVAWLHTDNKEAVARRLHIAPSTVRTHLQRIRRRYELVGRPANSKATLLIRALQDGLLAVGDL